MLRTRQHSFRVGRFETPWELSRSFRDPATSPKPISCFSISKRVLKRLSSPCRGWPKRVLVIRLAPQYSESILESIPSPRYPIYDSNESQNRSLKSTELSKLAAPTLLKYLSILCIPWLSKFLRFITGSESFTNYRQLKITLPLRTYPGYDLTWSLKRSCSDCNCKL